MDKKEGHKIFYKMLAGIFLIICDIGCIAFSLLTDKSVFMGFGGANVSLDWEVLLWPWKLINKEYTGLEMAATLFAVLILSAYIMLSILVHFRHSKTLYSITMIIITVDGIANFQHFHQFDQIPLIYQCLATGLIFATMVYFGPKGFELAAEAFSEFGVGRGASGRRSMADEFE